MLAIRASQGGGGKEDGALEIQQKSQKLIVLVLPACLFITEVDTGDR